ncbi:hypothetical protein MCOR02_004111 [Pyricularia oryzae]|uniref:Uncharacterized protein n=2 Tax=Pyricularia TaxID=48558 RepID=A0ABQ8N8G0_PYRGI|nr:hypothetical protein MCOR01_005923 [Pyricularia oryzae]KAI6292939.1 hypothetical protein MCOR33_009484 [Pyricularia grisea]KAH9435159.1 hypothetical protein MCOR02_004111 [Pyricularia oryzae]KAI6324201.1 hypothetical protein MCOR29_004143 [Pyricularia oryzae]KAI6328097.1 hypothetical protein MCOR34_000245 [Pyricularia oryzae]
MNMNHAAKATPGNLLAGTTKSWISGFLETSRLTLTRLVSLGAIQTLIFLPCSESQSSLLDPIAQPVCLSVLPTRSSEAIIPELHIPTPKGHATHKKYTSRDNQKCAASRMCSTGAAGRTPKRYGTSAKGRRRTVAGSTAHTATPKAHEPSTHPAHPAAKEAGPARGRTRSTRFGALEAERRRRDVDRGLTRRAGLGGPPPPNTLASAREYSGTSF